MDNQHRKIAGYAELTQEDIDLMNEITALGAQIAAVAAKVKARNDSQYFAAAQARNDGDPSHQAHLDLTEPYRWAAMARSDLQTGLMKLTRAVAQPTFF